MIGVRSDTRYQLRGWWYRLFQDAEGGILRLARLGRCWSFSSWLVRSALADIIVPKACRLVEYSLGDCVLGVEKRGDFPHIPNGGGNGGGIGGVGSLRGLSAGLNEGAGVGVESCGVGGVWVELGVVE